jgi:hypothetical protein
MRELTTLGRRGDRCPVARATTIAEACRCINIGAWTRKSLLRPGASRSDTQEWRFPDTGEVTRLLYSVDLSGRQVRLQYTHTRTG